MQKIEYWEFDLGGIKGRFYPESETVQMDGGYFVCDDLEKLVEQIKEIRCQKKAKK